MSDIYIACYSLHSSCVRITSFNPEGAQGGVTARGPRVCLSEFASLLLHALCDPGMVLHPGSWLPYVCREDTERMYCDD